MSEVGEVYLSTQKAAKLLGVHRMTLYRWARSGKIQCIRTPTGRIRFPLSELVKFKPKIKNSNDVAIYARIIDEEAVRRRLLEEQVAFLKNYARKMGYNIVEVVKDVGLSNEKSLVKLLELAKAGKIQKILVVSKDRLHTIFPELLEKVFRILGAEIEVVDWDSEEFKRTRELEIVELVQTLLLKMK
ncbi:MAG: helix-turn-helix domain-containing protein [Crenarchaeota archaeon]|nr:helix-turn-helix domain-containing protein [Thermoproteota archaeon]